ncbi:hypothetical protein MKW92_046163 [Papaver armeniacum]|nr:hypothetical protein MKW92_046163 [Papaver armeniacum]
MGSKKTTDLEALAERLQEQVFSSLSTLDLKLLAVKKQRVRLSLARVTMKKQKERQRENATRGRLKISIACLEFFFLLHSIFTIYPGKRKAEDSVLRSTDGYFKNGVLNVKHLLHNNSSRTLNFGTGTSDKGKKKQGGGKKKGGRKHGKKRHFEDFLFSFSSDISPCTLTKF